jgi:hypothetical protein
MYENIGKNFTLSFRKEASSLLSAANNAFVKTWTGTVAGVTNDAHLRSLPYSSPVSTLSFQILCRPRPDADHTVLHTRQDPSVLAFARKHKDVRHPLFCNRFSDAIQQPNPCSPTWTCWGRSSYAPVAIVQRLSFVQVYAWSSMFQPMSANCPVRLHYFYFKRHVH